MAKRNGRCRVRAQGNGKGNGKRPSRVIIPRVGVTYLYLGTALEDVIGNQGWAEVKCTRILREKNKFEGAMFEIVSDRCNGEPVHLTKSALIGTLRENKLNKRREK